MQTGDFEVVKLHKNPQGTRLKAFSPRWLVFLGFNDSQMKMDDLYVKLTCTEGNKIVLEALEPPQELKELKALKEAPAKLEPEAIDFTKEPLEQVHPVEIFPAKPIEAKPEEVKTEG